MSLLTREKVINEKLYSIILPTPRKIMPLCTKLAVLFGAIIPTLIKDAKSGGMESFGSALKNIDPESIDAIFMKAVEISHLCCNNEAVSTEISFDKHFSDHRGDVYQVCLWTLWECVKDFFPQLEGFSLDNMIAKE